MHWPSNLPLTARHIFVPEELLSTAAHLYMRRTDHDVLSSIATTEISSSHFEDAK